MLTRLFPRPVTSLLLLAVWLALQGTVAAAQVLLGLVLAFSLPLLLGRWLGPRRSWPRRPVVMLRLAGIVLRDVVVSNLEVTRRILGPGSALSPGFVDVPLAVTDPRAIGTLAAIITMTPGTLTASVDRDGSVLTVHALHVDDPAALIASIKARYEKPLQEIFG